MSYQPYLISNYATGLDRQLQPWLAVDDAFYELFDGYCYRGVTNKRDGYSAFATGRKSSFVESRMVRGITAATPATGAINGSNKVYTFTFTAPVARGSITITGSNPAQVVVDDSNGSFTGDIDPMGVNTINYNTGAATVTFLAAPIAASTVLANYSYHQGLPVMGIMRYYPDNNIPELIVADTKFVNRYDRTTDRLVDISPAFPFVGYKGDYQDFWSWVNYASPTFAPRLLFSNGKVGDKIQMWDGTTVTDFPAKMDAARPPVTAFDVNARQIFEFQDRLILFQTIENGTLFPRRIRISGFGAQCDNFDISAPGAGFIDIPDNTFFFGAAFNRDDLMFFTEAATWLLKYTGNDVTPFVLKKIDGSRGSKAAFSVISYLNRTMAASPRGLILVDGYTVNRMDESLPDFAFNSINNQFFQSCFSGFIDEDRDVYMMYPSKGDVRPAHVAEGSSDRILVSNFEEDNYAIYRIPISCMGNFEVANGILWSDLTAARGFTNWDDLAAQYQSWNAFPYSKAVPLAIAGGHKGEIWKLTENEIQDNPQFIRGMTAISPTDVQVTTDWNNYEVGDFIYFTAVQGMTQINGKQGVIQSIDTPYKTFTVEMGASTVDYDTWTSGGTASRVVPFEALTKKFNPFINTDKKLKCGWIYFYVTCTQTSLTTAAGAAETPFLDLEVFMNDHKDPTEPNFKYPVTPNQKYKIDLSSSSVDNSDFTEEKKWVKIWVNQVGKFLQFRLSNTQAGTKIQIQAMMPGFSGTGRLI